VPVCFHILQAGQTPLSIAQRLGYLSVIETLSQITTVTVAPSAMTGRYKPVSPETMQEVTLFEMEETSKWTSSLFLFKIYMCSLDVCTRKELSYPHLSIKNVLTYLLNSG